MLLELGLFITLLAFLCEYVDSTLGMGYGTTLTPILLLFGFEPLQIVPAVLLSELITGFLAAGAHHSIGNVNFAKDSVHLKIALLLGVCSIAGVIFAGFAVINLPVFYLKLYIGLLVLLMGILILWHRNSNGSFSWKKITGLGVLAAFNKGISGGGYGPLVVTGQMLSGLKGKPAIAITSLAEACTCLVGVLFYFFANSIIDWQLAPYLIVGAVLSVPFSAISLKKITEHKLTIFVGIAALLLGFFTLAKTFNLL
ncbi:sulfite exporter TauE/SafE family protein [Candidatus Micrarchaeota archaeon]|nr:sulfite exporter TauE/SafE family protein [Candidatus Micrarchaeota archaeon]